ncbi:MAG: PAS domain-containing protein [Rubrobacter sp.]|nr:PAS domain-containing protein [Rubrobacter sp.]
MESSAYSFLLFLTALCAAILAFYTWRRRKVAGAWPLVAFMVAVSLWSVGYAAEILAADIPAKVLWAKFQYFGIVAIPLVWLDFALRYSGRGGWPIRNGLALFATIPLATLALVWTNEFHGFIWATIEPTDSGALDLVRGPFFWVFWAYSYFLLLAGAVILGRVALRSANLYRKQSALLLGGVVAPWVGNSVYVLDLWPGFDFDLTPVGFLTSGAMFSLALFRFRLFDLGPVAREAVVEGMEDGVVVVDGEGRIVDVNPAACRILDLPESKAVGASASANVPGWDGGPGEVSLGEGEDRRDYEVSVSPLAGRRGKLAGSVGVLRDVTVRREAERRLRESELRLGAVVRNAPVVLFGLDGAGRFTFSEGKGLEALGAEPGEVVGKSVFEVYGDVPEIIDHVRRALGGEEFNALADVGGIRFETRYSPLFDGEAGKVSGVIGISLDVTERERAEAERERRAAELFRSNRELEQFSYSVSHDLRAPLRSIDGFSQILIEDYGDTLDDDAKNHLGRVRSASQRMGELIDDLLELSRINRVEMRWETVDMSRIAEEIAENLRGRDPGRNVNFEIPAGLTAEGNPRLLKLALENLMENAWKFTSRNENGATIKFGRDGDSFFVRDDGAGFEMEYAHKLFGAFQRLHDSEEFEGTGVGLATVARIIHRHGGEVRAEGEVGRGATFFFTL